MERPWGYSVSAAQSVRPAIVETVAKDGRLQRDRVMLWKARLSFFSSGSGSIAFTCYRGVADNAAIDSIESRANVIGNYSA